jgi:GT2 family glycosyltransferase
VKFLNSIDKKTTYPYYEVLIYNNNSEPELTDKLIQEIGKLNNKEKFKIIELGKYLFNLSQVYNRSLKDSDAILFIMSNNDMEVVNAEWLANIVKWFETTPNLGICVPFQDIIGNPLTTKPEDRLGDPGDMCWFAMYSIPRWLVNEIGGCDENVPLFFHDFDMHNTVRRKGYLIRWAYNAMIKHHGAVTVYHSKSVKHSYDIAYKYVHEKHPGK